MAARRTQGWTTILGAVLLVGYVVQAKLELTWPALARLQLDDTYKIASGLGVALYLTFQWAVVSRRARDPKRALRNHTIGGALAPLVLYLHASELGYGYLVVLVVTYLGNVLVGLVHQPMIQLRLRWLFTVWFVTHVVLSMVLVFLGAYHIAIALAYE